MALSTAEMEHQYRMEQLRSRTALFRALIRYLAIATVAICAVFFVRSLAGRQTVADLRFAAIADFRANKFFSQTFAWIVSGSGVVLATTERKLRKRVTKRLSKENRALQTIVDSGRLSSELMPSGDTRPGDE